MMNAKNCKRIQAAVTKMGDELKGKLPASAKHPERNSYAHVWRTIKEKYGCTYSECEDSDVDEMLALVKSLKS